MPGVYMQAILQKIWQFILAIIIVMYPFWAFIFLLQDANYICANLKNTTYI